MITQMTQNNISALANLMSNIKPDWWQYQETLDYLAEIIHIHDTVGWVFGESDQSPTGFLICKDFAAYSCLSFESWGYNDNGNFAVGQQMSPLFTVAEEYAQNKGHRLLRLVISSTDTTCHGKPLGEYWQALRDINSDSDYYKFYMEYGFKVSGFLPNCYGKDSHGVILVKEL